MPQIVDNTRTAITLECPPVGCEMPSDSQQHAHFASLFQRRLESVADTCRAQCAAECADASRQLWEQCSDQWVCVRRNLMPHSRAVERVDAVFDSCGYKSQPEYIQTEFQNSCQPWHELQKHMAGR